MPIASVHRVQPDYNYAGAQYIVNELVFPASPGTATVYLGSSVYSTGTYVLFDYTQSTSATPVTNFAQLQVDITDLLLASAATLYNDTANKVITVTLTANTDNGTQYVDGTLTISSPMTIYLDADLYGSAGTYTLFSYGSFVGSITNITIVPPPSRVIDTSVSANGCAISGSTITVKLL